MSDVVALGDVNVDIIAHYAAFPEEGIDAFAYSTEIHCGGSAANAAMALACLAVSTSLVARVGTDPWASFVLRRLASAGVVLNGLQQDPSLMTGLMYIIVTPNGERTILGYRGANALLDPDQVCKAEIRDAKLFHLSGYALLAEPQRSAALRALAMARQSDLTVSLDPGMSGSQAAVDELRGHLHLVDILLPNLAEAKQLTGLDGPEECALALLDEGVQVVAIKLGQEGCLLGSGDGFLRVPGFVTEVRDSTGAGDSFAAGLIAGLLNGLDSPSAAVLGNAMGALASASVGGGAVDLNARSVLALLQAHYDMPSYCQFREALGCAIMFVSHLEHKLNWRKKTE
jgi:ribokinase